jgi:hypothetical protein
MLASFVHYLQTPGSCKRQLRRLASASVWKMVLALISPPCCARVDLGLTAPYFRRKRHLLCFVFALP